MITGNLGKRGFQALDKDGMVVHAGCTEKVADIIQRCLRGELPKCKGATYAGYIGF